MNLKTLYDIVEKGLGGKVSIAIQIWNGEKQNGEINKKFSS
jgi:hypothetical protein